MPFLLSSPIAAVLIFASINSTINTLLPNNLKIIWHQTNSIIFSNHNNNNLLETEINIYELDTQYLQNENNSQSSTSLLKCNYLNYDLIFQTISYTFNFPSSCDQFIDIINHDYNNVNDTINWQLISDSINSNYDDMYYIDRLVVLNKIEMEIELIICDNSIKNNVPWHFSLYEEEFISLSISDIDLGVPLHIDLDIPLHELYKNPMNEYPSNSVTLDVRLLLGVTINKSNNNIEISKNICGNINSIFNRSIYFDSFSKFPFIISSGYQSSQQSILFWLDYCGKYLNTTVVHLWEHPNAISKDKTQNKVKIYYDRYVNNDHCNVKKITGNVLSNLVTSKILSSNTDLRGIYCLEQVLELLSIDYSKDLLVLNTMGLGRITNNKLNFSNYCDLPMYLDKCSSPILDEFYNLLTTVHSYWRLAKQHSSINNKQAKFPKLIIKSIFNNIIDPINNNKINDNINNNLNIQEFEVNSLNNVEDDKMDDKIFDAPDLSFSNIHILIFVLDFQLFAAQQIIKKWKTERDRENKIMTYSMFIKPTIFVLPLDYFDDNQIDVINCTNLLNLTPSIRHALLSTKEYIDNYCNTYDITTLLIGMEALLSFSKPADETHDHGLVPPIEYGQNKYYNLKSEIVVASKITNSLYKDSIIESDLEIKGICGISSNIRKMLISLQSNDFFSSSYRYSSNSGVTKALKMYLIKNYKIVTIDYNNVVFNFSVGNKLLLTSISYSLSLSKLVFLNDIGSDSSLICVFPGYDGKYVNKNEDIIETVDNVLKYIYTLHGIDTQEVSDYQQKNNNEISKQSLDAIEKIISDEFLRGNTSTSVIIAMSVFSTLIEIVNNLKNFNNNIKLSKEITSHMIKSSISKLSTLGMKIIFFSELSSFVEYSKSAEIINKYLNNYHSNNNSNNSLPSSILGNTENFHHGMYLESNSALSSIYRETGPFQAESSAISKVVSLFSTSYSKMIDRQSLWLKQRSNLRRITNDDITAPHIVHYLTVASESTPGLRALQLTAYIANINLEVLGLGEPYNDYYDKMLNYQKHVNSNIKNNIYSNDDIIVLIDAYDVLLSPAVRTLGIKLSQSKSPIVTCTEYGLHPIYSTGVLYRQGGEPDVYFPNNKFIAKYLNSGCIIGRAGQIKDMLNFAVKYGEYIRDDQEIYVRYHLLYPDLISLDIERKIAITGHKMIKNDITAIDSNTLFDVMFINNGEVILLNTPIIHCNNIHSSSLHSTLTNTFSTFLQHYYTGNDGKLLLSALHELLDSEYDLNDHRNIRNCSDINSKNLIIYKNIHLNKAKKILLNPIIQSNLTSNGGYNHVGDEIYKRIKTIEYINSLNKNCI